VTSNPTIFGKAIGGSTDYDEAIAAIVEKNGREPIDIFYDLALEDIQGAADVFSSAYEASGGRDGFVSFELEPRLAHDTRGSIDKATELFEQLNRPNVMIKVPGTPEGVPAVEELTARGVNVNITLLFSVEMYEQVALAYIRGLERRLDSGESLEAVASVASFFVSRVDTAVDRRLGADSPLRGKIAVANAKVAYRRFREIFSGPAWDRLQAAGASLQRPLWASTGTKDAAYSDVLYVETLVGPDTVNTMPQATMDAFRDHGKVNAHAVAQDMQSADEALARLAEDGVDLKEITDQLTEEGIASFDADLAKLLGTIEQKVDEVRVGHSRWSGELGPLAEPVAARLGEFHDEDLIRRIWKRDHTVWNEDPTEIADRLGWLTVADLMDERVAELTAFTHKATYEGFEQAVLLGMGGSSLAPEVYAGVFGVASWAMRLSVLDTTHPAAVAALEESINPARTLFIVASKSGETVETLSHFKYFHNKVRNGNQFVAITDPGSPLHSLAREKGFREVFLNPGDIGGRYSALSLFGLVPAALCGADLDLVIDKAREMETSCHSWVHPEENPGAWLGAVLGESARAGRDKATMLLSGEMNRFGDWAEQLFAESTGKNGIGVIPIAREEIGPPEVYGDDRLFIS
ncbi:MAG: bifunctional transaldolase/phosoglucose isomerase, partial [Actinomycetota bacterium]